MFVGAGAEAVGVGTGIEGMALGAGAGPAGGPTGNGPILVAKLVLSSSIFRTKSARANACRFSNRLGVTSMRKSVVENGVMY